MVGPASHGGLKDRVSTIDREGDAGARISGLDQRNTAARALRLAHLSELRGCAQASLFELGQVRIVAFAFERRCHGQVEPQKAGMPVRGHDRVPIRC